MIDISVSHAREKPYIGTYIYVCQLSGLGKNKVFFSFVLYNAVCFISFFLDFFVAVSCLTLQYTIQKQNIYIYGKKCIFITKKYNDWLEKSIDLISVCTHFFSRLLLCPFCQKVFRSTSHTYMHIHIYICTMYNVHVYNCITMRYNKYPTYYVKCL